MGFKLGAGIVAQILIFGLLLFVPAGTLDWWRAWVFLALLVPVTIAGSLSLLHVSEGLIAERLKPPIQKGQPLADQILTPVFLAAYVGALVFIPIDVFRLHLLPQPGPIAAAAGLLLFGVGWWIVYRALRENAFAAPVIKVQADRGQAVVDTGPYRIVRHPMYAGGMLVLFGLPLWLDSSAATLVALVPSVLLALRILIEDDVLRRELPGYAAYERRVPYRLIPYVW